MDVEDYLGAQYLGTWDWLCMKIMACLGLSLYFTHPKLIPKHQ